jgi:NADH-quinone oxidoreductase subunit N
MWTPDVYEGAPTPVTAFFAAAPKVAAMAVLVRIVIDAFEPVTLDWQQIVVFISIGSMAAGRLCGNRPEEHQAADGLFLDRHMGFALVGLAAGSQAGVRGVIFYMLIYMA